MKIVYNFFFIIFLKKMHFLSKTVSVHRRNHMILIPLFTISEINLFNNVLFCLQLLNS